MKHNIQLLNRIRTKVSTLEVRGNAKQRLNSVDQENECVNEENEQVQKRKYNDSGGSTQRRGKYKIGAGKCRFSLMKAPTPAEM